MTASITELKTLPPPLPTFLKAALTAARRPPADVRLPELQVRLTAVRIDRARLKAYCKLLGFPERDALPLTYLHVIGSSLHMYLMSQPAFPLPMLGLVHLRNTISQMRPVMLDETLELMVKLVESRDVALGLEFDLLTEFTDGGGERVWSGVSTYLYRMRGKSVRSRPPPPQAEIPLSQYLEVNAPEDIGRRYAKVSGDYNPIHLHALSAKLFGFKRAIATGMWSAAKVLALLESRLKTPAAEFDFQFKQPFMLPGKAALRFEPGSRQIDFALVGTDGGKVHLIGTLR